MDMNEYFEDKKCRICGFADMSNSNIFSANQTLLEKILFVYPIVVYKNDPLPKNICKKCIHTVSHLYTDIQRVLKTQAKWISNVRTVQPQNNYIRMLEYVEDSMELTKKNIKTLFHEDVDIDRTRQINLLGNEADKAKRRNSTQPMRNQIYCGKKAEIPVSTKIECIRKVLNSTASQNAPLTQGSNKGIQDISTILEKNGCSLVKIKSTPATTVQPKPCESANHSLKSVIVPPIQVNPSIIKTEPLDEEEVKANSSCSNLSQPIKSADIPKKTIKCGYCSRHFNSVVALSMHQLKHLRLSVTDINEKRLLEKIKRRGRLINVEDRKCIRCLNCWRVFVDNKTILDHWALGLCHFYCNICGKAFPQEPKLLREHVPAAHGITLKSSRTNGTNLKSLNDEHLCSQPQLIATTSTNSHEQPAIQTSAEGSFNSLECNEVTTSTIPTPMNHFLDMPSSQTVNSEIHSCLQCPAAFPSIKALNSHMRKHKPSSRNRMNPDLYLCSDDFTVKKVVKTYERSKNPDNGFIPHANTLLNNSKNTLSGIRTKFVPPRTVFNSSNVSTMINTVDDMRLHTSNSYSTSLNESAATNSYHKEMGLYAGHKPQIRVAQGLLTSAQSNLLTTTTAKVNAINCFQTAIKAEPMDDYEM